jgi:hypothetical protein
MSRGQKRTLHHNVDCDPLRNEANHDTNDSLDPSETTQLQKAIALSLGANLDEIPVQQSKRSRSICTGMHLEGFFGKTFNKYTGEGTRISELIPKVTDHFKLHKLASKYNKNDITKLVCCGFVIDQTWLMDLITSSVSVCIVRDWQPELGEKVIHIY